MFLRDLHRVERPKERIEAMGPEALSDRELLALIIGGDRGLKIAEEVLRDQPELGNASLAALQKVKGLNGKSVAVAAALELGRRNARGFDPRPVLDTPEKVAHHVPIAVKKATREHFVGFYLNARSQLLHMETISIGTLSASLVHPREVFHPAISHAAAALVVVHNHPSGDCRPSNEDKDATRRLARSGELLGIPLLDHVIVSATGYHSLKESGSF